MKGYKKYFLKKLLWYALTFVVALLLNFFLPRLIPGNPVQLIVSKITEGMADANRMTNIYNQFYSDFGLDKPLFAQFWIYVKNLFQGNFGVSFGQYPRTVADIIVSAVPWTVGIQLPSILIGWLLGNLLGALAAYRRGAFDKVTFPFSMFLNSIPPFIFSLLLLYIFAVSLKWFPIGGAYPITMLPHWGWSFFFSILRHWALPFISLTLVYIGGQAIGMRSMSLYELNADYVLYAKLMGIRDRRVVRYVFRNAVLPQVTGLAHSLGTMVAGALVTEQVFSYPGIGSVLLTAIRNTDYSLISGCTLLITLTVLAANFLIEILYGIIDPRIRIALTEE